MLEVVEVEVVAVVEGKAELEVVVVGVAVEEAEVAVEELEVVVEEAEVVVGREEEVVVVEEVEEVDEVGVTFGGLFWACLRREMKEATSALGKRAVSCCCCLVVFPVFSPRASLNQTALYFSSYSSTQ